MILLYWREILALILIVALGACGLLLKYEYAANSTLKVANLTLSNSLTASNNSIETLKAAILQQNAAIDKLKNDADLQVLASEAAIANAKVVSKGFQDRSKVVLNSKGTTCEDASKLIDQELSK